MTVTDTAGSAPMPAQHLRGGATGTAKDVTRRSGGPARTARQPSPSAAWWRRRDGVGVYVVSPIVAAIAVASWHTPGRFIAGGDIGPFVRAGLGGDVGSLWGYGLSGAGSPTAEIARLPELVVYRTAEWAGLAPEVGQLAFFWLWLAAASAACIFLVRQLVTSRVAQGTIGLLAIANPLMAVNLPNPLMPAALCTLALVAGVLIRTARGQGQWRVTVLATLPASYLAINPPTLAVVGFSCVVALAVGVVFVPTARRPLIRHVASTAPVLLLAHLWWILPAAIAYAGSSGATVTAVTDPEAWSWTHVNSSVANVTTLTAHWGWGIHAYLPFSEGLDRFPVSPLRWALPALAGIGPLVAATKAARRVALGALGVAVACVIVGKGLHGPAAWFNLELYRRVPGMWLLREPMSKIGPVLLLSFLVSAAIALDGATTRLRATTNRRGAAGSAAMAAIVVSAVVFGHPVLTGGIAPEDRTPLPSSRVAVPAGWFELAADVNADPLAGKALILPTLPFYQATTTWGFHGAATLPRDLLRRPTLLGLPGGYFADPPVVTALIDLVADAMDAATVDRALDALGVSHIIVRTDLSDAQAVRPISAPDALLRRLIGTGVFEPPRDYNAAIVLRRRVAPRGASVFTHAATVAAATPDGLARAVASLEPNTTAVTDGVTMDVGTSIFDGDAGRIDAVVRVPSAGPYDLETAPYDVVTALATRAGHGASIDAHLVLRVDGRLRGRSSPISVPGSGAGSAVALIVDDTPVLLADDPVVVDVPVGAPVQVLTASAPRPVVGWSEVGDCNAVDDHDPAVAAASDRGLVELSAARHTACVTAPGLVTGPVLIRFETQVIRGRSARACLWSDAARSCVWERTVERTGTGWQPVADIVDAPADARLVLYADAELAPARVRYRDVEFVPVTAGPPVVASLTIPAVRLDLTAGEHTLELTQPSTGLLASARLGPPSPVGNCDARSAKPGVSSTADGGSIRLEADRDAACVNYVVGDLAPGISYDISFEYRTLSTGQARWCLWLDGMDRCANDEQLLTQTPSWAVLSYRAEIPEGATGVRLFVYADGRPERGEPTINEYRRPSVRAATPSTVTLTSASISREDEVAPEQATLLVAHGSGDRWRLGVRGAGLPFVLALPDAMDARWGLEGLPQGATAQPMTVDGYRQAWLISDLDGDAHLTARYAPAGAARAARWGAMALLTTIALPLRRIGRLRRSRDASPTTWTRRLALGVIRAARWLLRGTFVQRLGITTWCYRRVARLAAGAQRNIPVTFRGLDLLAPAADITITPTLATGDYERTAIDAFIRLVPTGGTVVDVGANIGVLSLLAARAVGPRGTVFAFEPIRQNRDLASSNAARNGIANIRMIDKAVGDTEGLLTLYRSEADCGTHSAGLASGTPERVEVVRLEDWASREGLTSIDALKIDVEGFDGFALDGARRLVIAWRPVLLIEYVPRQLEACGDDPERVALMLLTLPGVCLAVDERRRQLVPVRTLEELTSALGPAGGNILIAHGTDLLDDLIHPR